MPAFSVPLPDGPHQPLLAALVAYAENAFALPAPTSGPVVTLRSSWNLVRLDVNDPPLTRYASLALLAAFRACFQGYALGTTPVSLVVRTRPPTSVFTLDLYLDHTLCWGAHKHMAFFADGGAQRLARLCPPLSPAHQGAP